MRGARAAAAALLAGLALGTFAPGAGATVRDLKLGVVDDSFLSTDAGLREMWMGKAQQARANLAMLGATWSGIAPSTRPPGFDATNPAEPSYEWTRLDAGVRGALRHGMQPVLVINRAPAWAEGPNRPSKEVAEGGTWRPQPQELGRFARALAARYSGRFRDPGTGRRLPRVRYFQVWAEQNLYVHLNPQWKGGRMFAPHHYRAMLNAAYAGIHRVNPRAKVITGGLSPYGDPRPGPSRIPPVWFWRALLCLQGSKLKPVKCPNPARFDIWAHNPINVGGPGRHALNPFDVSTPDIGKLTPIVRKAVRTRRALPARPKPFWATEIWWDSKPPDPRGVPARRHARFVTKALYSLWQQGASAVVWWYVRDQSGEVSFSGTQQSGLFMRDGRAKPAFRAFRFPFIAGRARGGGVFFWGKAPRAGRVVVERRTSRGWAPLLRTVAGRGGMFTARVSSRGFRVRARQRGQASLPWRAR